MTRLRRGPVRAVMATLTDADAADQPIRVITEAELDKGTEAWANRWRVAQLRAEMWALDNEGAYLGVPMPEVEGWGERDGDCGVATREWPACSKGIHPALAAHVEGTYSNGLGQVRWTWQ